MTDETRTQTPATSAVLQELQQHGALLREIADARGREEPPATLIDLTMGRHITRVAFRLTDLVIGANAATDFDLMVGTSPVFTFRTGADTKVLPIPIDLKGGVEVYIRSAGAEPPNIAALRGAYLIGYPKS